MKRFSMIAAAVALTLSACASDPEPKIVQSQTTDKEIHLTAGMATQLEMPKGERVTNVTVGDPKLVVATSSSDVVGLSTPGGVGETNILVRVVDKDGDAKVHKYRLTVTK